VALAMSHPLGMGNALHRNPDHEGYAEGACFPMFRRAVFDRIGLYDESLVRNQDDELNGRLVRSGGKVWQSPRARAAYRVRESPAALFRQFFQYGFWRTAVLRRQRYKTSLRRFVPATMLVVFCATVFLALWHGGAWIVTSGILLVFYLTALLVVGLVRAGARAPGVALRFPVAAAIMHLAYALGFIWSLGASPERSAPAGQGRP